MKKPFYHYITITIVLLYLLVPLLGTFLYSFATSWHKTILPEGMTFKWYLDLFGDVRFLSSLGRSLIISLGSTIITLVIMVPAIFSIVLYAPKLEKLIQSLIVMTYAMPGIILAVGLIRAYSNSGISMVVVTMGAYFVGILPYMYQGTRNSLRNIHAESLMEAAEMLGASRLTAFLKVIVPNIMSGILVSALLSFSILFGEFVLVNLLVGGSFETVQVYLYQKLNQSGHIASAIVVCYFVLISILSAIMVKATRTKKETV
ncbi:ABC transporter permease subunit [Neobacillus cucumis]|uniref:ABC transporter permease n=1 Tax=Neobacillus cucumis TaxID=1740721 RepID=UPI0018DF23CC|nr:ABC transporter permease subunit [Neobacillus cucumis]MBI0578995.1 ABC transporter permease subunit [Neobacillus cucumis]WHY89505.1 ABC transporter permease subunit [Neobacillus cucumis]